MNRPRASVDPQLRVPPTDVEIETLFSGWRTELATCRKFSPAARNYAVARLASAVGLRINEARILDLDDVRWELGRFGKLNVRHGKGSRHKGPKPWLVPLINGGVLDQDRICRDEHPDRRHADWASDHPATSATIFAAAFAPPLAAIWTRSVTNPPSPHRPTSASTAANPAHDTRFGSSNRTDTTR